MKGTISAFDPTTFRGSINAYDGQEYEFTAQDWRELRTAKPGIKVDFQNDGTQAHEIYFDDRVTAIMAQYPGPVTFQPSLMARAEWLGGGIFAAFIAFVCALTAATSKSVTLPVFLEVGGVFLSGAGAIVALLTSLVPGAAKLRLDKDGFEETVMFTSKPVRWEASLLSKPGTPKKNGLASRAKSIFRIGGLSRVDLTRLMRRWCERAIED